MMTTSHSSVATHVWRALFALMLISLVALGCDDTTNPDPGDGGADTGAADADASSDDTSTPDDTGQVRDLPDQVTVDSAADTNTVRDTSTVQIDAIDTFMPSTDDLSLESVMPSSGPSAGQNIARINGAGFTPDMEVFFGGDRSLAVGFVDDTSVEVTVPAGSAGLVDVKAVNANGNATLEGAYTYIDPITVESITPDRSPTTGGIPFVLVGSGFTDGTAVSIGGRTAIDVRVDSATSLTGVTPPGVVGTADVRVTNDAGSTLAADLVTYFEPTRIDAIFPAAGPTTGGNQAVISGSGFEGSLNVMIGNRAATIVAESATELTVTIPAQTAGPRDVIVSSDNGSDRIEDGYNYFDTPMGVQILGVYPASGPAAGGNDVIISGYGFDALNLTASIGGSNAAIVDVADTSIRVTAPMGSVGLADVTVSNDDGSATRPDGYEYLPLFEITGVNPAEGPVIGGTSVTINGAGFDANTTVRFGPLAASGVTLVSPTEITADSPAGSAGLVDVVVDNGTQSDSLVDGFLYTSDLAVFAISPRKGSQSGGTIVTIAGTGFAAGALVNVDGTPGTDVLVLDGSTIEFKTPAHAPAIVEVEVVQGGQTAASPVLYTYYDPVSVFGGGWGNSIDGAVNVTVLTAPPSVAPVADAFVILNTDLGTPYQGLTDANGQITFSGPDVLGTQTITASKEEHTSATVETIDAENVTIFISSLDSSSGDPPPGVAPGSISGTITGADKVSLLNDPNKIRLSLVVTTQISPFQPNPDPGPNGQVQGGDGTYSITSRLGDVAVIGMCGLYDLVTGSFEPKYMAMQRFMFITEGSQHTVNLNCSIKLDEVMTFKMVDSPLDEEPDENVVLPYLQVGAEGVIGGYAVAEGTTDTIVTANQAPLTGALANMSYYLIGGAFTSGGTPYSLVQMDNVTDFSATIEFGPLLALPQLVAPVSGGTVQNGYVEWTMDDPDRVDMYAVSIAEPSFPPTPIWDIYLPGSATSFSMPQFMPGSGAAAPYEGLASISFDAIHMNTPFDFDTFTTNDLFFSARDRWSTKSDFIFF